MSGLTGRPGTLVISLDFELRWGVRDHCPPGSPYERSLHGARQAIPGILSLFEEYGVRATWATVGFLFASSRQELESFRPASEPTYIAEALNPYHEVVGENESADPLHFAPSLIERIRASPGQEVATHTYSHYLCNEPGQTAEQFRADLQAAMAIARARGITLESIVFPRNQHNPAYSDILRENGIIAYRGNPDTWMWRYDDPREGSRRGRRLARLFDTYVGLTGNGTYTWEDLDHRSGVVDVPASFFLRPYDPRLRHLESLRLRRLRKAIEAAARRRRLVHLWWHPHNFGRHPAESLSVLREVLDAFDRCRTDHGMLSATMAEVATAVLGTVKGSVEPERRGVAEVGTDPTGVAR